MRVILISLSIFFTTLFLILLLFEFLTRRQRLLKKRLENVSNVTVHPVKVKVEREQAPANLQNLLANTGKLLARRGLAESFERELQKADIPLRGEEYLMIRIISAVVPAALVLLVSGQLLLALTLALCGFLLPPLFVSSAQQRRLKKFNLQLIDSLAIMANSLRAGYSFMQAVELVSKEMPAPIGKEFARTFREVNLGTPMEEALHNLGARITSQDLDLVLTAVLIQRQVGGNLAEIMDGISSTIRERIRIQGEIRTLTAQGRISGLIIGLVPPVLILIISLLNPGYLEPLFQTPAGWSMLAAGAASEFVGLVIIRKIIAVEM